MQQNPLRHRSLRRALAGPLSALATVSALACSGGAEGAEASAAGVTGQPVAVDPAGCEASAQQVESTLAFVRALPHPKAYEPLGPLQMSSVGQAAAQLAQGQVEEARRSAAGAQYEVRPLVSKGECLYVLAPAQDAPVGQGTMVVRPQPQRDLVLEAPHVPNDGHTDEEAALLFDQLGARAMILAGADRCAVQTPSGCVKNKGCRDDGVAVESDSAHSVQSAFHAMHLALGTGGSQSRILQLHTNLDRELNGEALTSDGTRVQNPSSPAAIFGAALKQAGADARRCNDPADGVTGKSLCGLANSQALATNGVGDQCLGDEAQVQPSGRFIHLEQNTQRMKDVESWAKLVGEAYVAAFPE